MKQTYWNHAGKYQATIVQLQELIPTEGAVGGGAKNKSLERFRKAVNCYYDLYNNGLCNRAREFAAVIGLSSSQFRINNRSFSFSQILYELTEERINVIIEAAAAEQGIELSTQMDMFA